MRDFIKFSIKATYVFMLLLLALFLGGLIIYQTVVKPAQEKDSNYENSFQVQGSAKRKATPDQATIILGTKLTGNNPTELQNEGHQKINQAINNIKALGVKEENISTNNYSLTPLKNSDNTNIINYEIDVNVRVLIENTKPEDKLINDVITAGNSAKLNEVRQLSFVISNHEEIQDELRLEAIEDAKSKATALADKAGLKIGEIKNINSGNDYVPLLQENARTISAPASDTIVDPIRIEPGQYEISAQVTLLYEIK